jgi:hypothetical protein
MLERERAYVDSRSVDVCDIVLSRDLKEVVLCACCGVVREEKGCTEGNGHFLFCHFVSLIGSWSEDGCGSIRETYKKQGV